MLHMCLSWCSWVWEIWHLLWETLFQVNIMTCQLYMYCISSCTLSVSRWARRRSWLASYPRIFSELMVGCFIQWRKLLYTLGVALHKFVTFYVSHRRNLFLSDKSLWKRYWNKYTSYWCYVSASLNESKKDK